MPLLLTIYLFCVIGACLYVLLVTWITKQLIRDDIELSNAYFDWYNEPLRRKLGVVFFPVINLVYSLRALYLIYIQVKSWWFHLGLYTIKKFTQGKELRHFRIKELIVRIFFHNRLDLFYKRFENDTWDKIITKVLRENKRKTEQKQPDPIDNAV